MGIICTLRELRNIFVFYVFGPAHFGPPTLPILITRFWLKGTKMLLNWSPPIITMHVIVVWAHKKSASRHTSSRRSISGPRAPMQPVTSAISIHTHPATPQWQCHLEGRHNSGSNNLTCKVLPVTTINISPTVSLQIKSKIVSNLSITAKQRCLHGQSSHQDATGPTTAGAITLSISWQLTLSQAER